MKLSEGDKTIGVSFYTEGTAGTPVSITFATRTEPDWDLSLNFPSSLDKKEREKEEAALKERMSRPRRLYPTITVGLGLDRVTTAFRFEDFDALLAVMDRVRDEIRTKEVEVERYERERKEQGE